MRLGRLFGVAAGGSLQHQLKLVERLGTGPKAVAAHTRQLVFELLDQNVARADLGLLGKHQRLQLIGIVRQSGLRIKHTYSIAEQARTGNPLYAASGHLTSPR